MPGPRCSTPASVVVGLHAEVVRVKVLGAEVNKLEMICAKLELQPGDHVLDIGWAAAGESSR